MRCGFPRILFALLVLAVSGCARDVQTNTFASRFEAEDIIARGWIPEVLPHSAVQIYESHNLDLNVSYGTFEFGSAGVPDFKAALTPLPPAHPSEPEARGELETEGYVFYSHDDFVLAVDWPDRKAQFWLALRR
jgi:hypothetical protein